MVILKDTLTFSLGLTLAGFIIRDAAANAAGCGVPTVVDVVSDVVAVEVETGVVVVTSDVLVVVVVFVSVAVVVVVDAVGVVGVVCTVPLRYR